MDGEAWLSLVERCVRDAEVAGSNPVTSTIYKKPLCQAVFFLIYMPVYFASGRLGANRVQIIVK